MRDGVRHRESNRRPARLMAAAGLALVLPGCGGQAGGGDETGEAGSGAVVTVRATVRAS